MRRFDLEVIVIDEAIIDDVDGVADMKVPIMLMVSPERISVHVQSSRRMTKRRSWVLSSFTIRFWCAERSQSNRRNRKTAGLPSDGDHHRYFRLLSRLHIEYTAQECMAVFEGPCSDS